MILMIKPKIVNDAAIIMTFNIASNGETLTLPLATDNGSQFNFVVDWGDGQDDTITSASASHIYSTSGIKTVSITGQMEGWHFGGNSQASKLLTMSGGDGHVFKYLCGGEYGAFEECVNLTTFNCPKLDVSQINNLEYLFFDCILLTTCNVQNWDVSNVNILNTTFNCKNLPTLELNNWDTSSVTDMSFLCYGCETLTTLEISDWNTSSVTNLDWAFHYLLSMKLFDVSKWNTSNVTRMENTFNYCHSETIDVNDWDVNNVDTMAGMFNFASGITSLNLSKWSPAKIEEIPSMFMMCTSLITLNIPNLVTNTVTNMNNTFLASSNLVNIIMTNWNTTGVTHMIGLCKNCTSLTTTMPANLFWDNLDGGTSVTSKSNAFLNATNISNYSSIPASWGGGGA